MPSSATARLGQRETSLDLLEAIPHLVPASWRLCLLPDHVVRIEAALTVELPVSAVGLVGELSRFLLEAAPFLDVLQESGMDWSAGEADGVSPLDHVRRLPH